MKRVLLATVATVAGLIALLSFKTHSPQAGSSAVGADSIAPAVLSPAAPTSLPPSAAPVSGSTPGSRASTPAKRTTAARPPTSRAASSASRTLLGSSVTTRFGVVQVRITVSGNRILSAAMAQLTAFDGHSAQINSFAAPILLRETISAQDARIDTVSGATYTSDGYIQSLQSALDQTAIR